VITGVSAETTEESPGTKLHHLEKDEPRPARAVGLKAKAALGRGERLAVGDLRPARARGSVALSLSEIQAPHLFVKSGIKRMSSSAKRHCDRALQARSRARHTRWHVAAVKRFNEADLKLKLLVIFKEFVDTGV
jgi:hypothetical protein